MADRLVAIRRLLTHERQDRRVAAAIVMSELGVNDKRSINALSHALDDEDPMVRRYALEALGLAQSESSVDRLIEALSDPDPSVQAAAEAALLQLGDTAVPALRKMMDGPAVARRRAAAVLGRLESSAGIDSLIDSVNGSDAAVLDRARQALRAKAPELSAAELRDLRKRVEQRLNDARHNNEHNLAAALLPLLGDLPDETVVTRLMQEIGREVPLVVRRAALTAMISALPQARGRRREAAIEKLLEGLLEEEEEGITRPTLRVLKDVVIAERLAPRLQELIGSPAAAVRAFALGELGRLGSPDSVATLVDHLVTGSAPVRAAARDALSNAPEAATALAQALLNVEDAARREELGELLRRHSDKLPASEAKSLCGAVLDRIEAGPEGLSSLIDTVARNLPEPFIAEVRLRLHSHRRTGELAEAYGLLDALRDCPAFGEEERFQLAILGLMRNTDAKDRPPRAADRICAPFGQLLHTGFPLEGRLRRERLIRVKDLYFLGFAYSESYDEDERDFGHELLEEVVRREPEGKFGSRAKNKLKLTQR